jgi:hypothetical protein
MRANNYLSGLKVESSRRIAAGYGSASVDVLPRIRLLETFSQVAEIADALKSWRLSENVFFFHRRRSNADRDQVLCAHLCSHSVRRTHTSVERL